MSARRKQLVANSIVVLGVLPLTVWYAAILVTRFRLGWPEGASAGLSDALVLLAGGAIAYLLALLIALPASIWSARILRSNRQLPRAFSVAARVVVATLMLLPVFAVGAIYVARYA